MRYLFSLILFCSFAFASTLLSLTASEDGGKIDVVLSFDSSYDGSIEQSMGPRGPVLAISDAAIESKKEITFKSNVVKKIILEKESPSRATLRIESDQPLSIQAQKSSDGQKLQFAIMPQDRQQAQEKQTESPLGNDKSAQFAQSFSQKFDQKREVPQAGDDLTWRYVVVIAFMAVLLIALVLVKKFYANKNAELMQAKNRFNAGHEQDGYQKSQQQNRRQEVAKQDTSFANALTEFDEGALKIVSQKNIDNNNKLVALEYEGDKFLIVIGPNSTIVERSSNDKRAREFEEIFFSNERKMQHYIQASNMSKLDLYKARAEGE